MDIIVANPVDTFGFAATKLVIIDNQGSVMRLPLMSKKELAKRIVKLIHQK